MDQKTLPAALILWLTSAALSASAAEPMPIFDAHMHYSRSAWDVFDPKAVVRKMDTAGVTGALVSSTPDDGTLALARAAPARFVPELRPYRTPGDMMRWHGDAEVLDYIEGRLESGRYVGVGEFHMFDRDGFATPQMKRLTAIAIEQGLIFHAHIGSSEVRALLTAEPRLKILWAHAGLGEPAAAIARTMDAFPTLMADLSYRAADLRPEDEWDPVWRRMLIRHADRFMVGTDTWTVDRWDSYGDLIAEHRVWLETLPPDVARKIAHENARRLFGAR